MTGRTRGEQVPSGLAPLGAELTLVHPRLPNHPPPPTAADLRPRVDARPIRRKAPTESPLAERLDLVARSDGHGHDGLRGLDDTASGAFPLA